ncbi:retrovirus-related pol polyprotein from transposon TNT 1-94 [Tanacetum coccineum]
MSIQGTPRYFCLKKKSDAVDCIMSFIKKMENLNEVRVKELRSDNGTKLRNHKLEEFYDEKGISHNFSSLCTPKQNGVAKRRNRTLIEATRTISIIVKRYRKTVYDVFRGRAPNISYLHVFGCPSHIHNHRDHLGKFDEKADGGFFLGYSLMAKAFRVFKIRKQEIEKTVHVTFSKDDEAISQTSTEAIHEPNHAKSAGILEFDEPQDNVLNRWSRDKHIELVNIIGEPLAGITTRSRIRDSDAASAHECLYVNFLSEIEPKKLIKALEEEGWVVVMQEELNQFKRNKEGIDYEETFAHVARLDAIRIFLAYAAYMGFVVYQMDVKSAFLNGKLSEEVYIQQPPGFESSEFPDHVCKLDKALYQANPKESHLVAVKRIFKYLKGAPNLSLWYPKGSCFDLKAYSDSDYAGCNLDRNSTSGGCHILGGKLVCWSAKKKSSVAISSAEAGYVAVVGCCAQVLWIKSQLANYDVLYDKVPIFCNNTSAIAISNNPVLHSRTKHIDIRYHFIRDHILKGDIELHFVPTEMQLADIFTKPLAEASFTRLIAELGMLNIEKQVSDKKKALSDL